MASPGRMYRSPRGALRLERALCWLAGRRPDERVLVVGASLEAASELVRRAASEGGAVFGWERMSLGRLAAMLAEPQLAARGTTPASALLLEALVARVVHGLARAGGLGSFAEVAQWPGFSRALSQTLAELRLGAIRAEALAPHAPDLARLLAAYEEELSAARLADRALVLSVAAREAASGDGLGGAPVLALDVPVLNPLERDLVGALAARAPAFLLTVASGDERTWDLLRGLLVEEPATPPPARPSREAPGQLSLFEELEPGAAAPEPSVAGALARLQEQLFGEEAPLAGECDEAVAVLSAPGESRECVEIARRVRVEAERGVPFDRMAILLRGPETYRAHLEEAFRRAQVPAYFARGTRWPDPAGRAFLSLLGCAAEDLSARRFAEYLSLGEVPEATPDGAPAPPAPAAERFAPPDEEMLPRAMARPEEGREEAEEAGPAEPVQDGSLRAPWRWERLLVEAAVIGGEERWRRRLAGLEAELKGRLKALDDEDDPRSGRIRRDLDDLASLARFALPLIATLAAFPARATWGEWLERLGALASQALRRPERVYALLAELAPMAGIGPVDLREVRLVLGRRLSDLVRPPSGRRYGSVYVAPVEACRGLCFTTVFVPGLAEKLFPQKVSEDPLLRDGERDRIGAGLATNEDRIAGERLLLRLAVGAARERVVLSYPRLDLEQGRPRVPSFYGLDVYRAVEGRLPGFEELMSRAERGGAARIGWPAPQSPDEAIDEAEHDLALLYTLFGKDEQETRGTARYLLGANPHLERALRARARRWRRSWSGADGLVAPAPVAAAALRAHQLDARSFSPTALQQFAACPYRFVLYALLKLAPREDPEPIEELDPLSKGSLVHEIQFQLLSELQAAGLLPVDPGNLRQARERLERVVDEVAERYRDLLAPAIPRVWEDGIASIRADLREWLLRASRDTAWTPWRFELAFGLGEDQGARDAHSSPDPVPLACGIRLRGSIDLVEQGPAGALRATDHKTGKARAAAGTVIGGGSTLQPVLYALALERLFPGTRVESGRLYYCTSTGEFEQRVVPLDDAARQAAQALAATLDDALRRGFLPAAPQDRACEYCDYRAVCGPEEELRARQFKSQPELQALAKLRKMP